jgi:hypothetical protein
MILARFLVLITWVPGPDQFPAAVECVLAIEQWITRSGLPAQAFGQQLLKLLPGLADPFVSHALDPFAITFASQQLVVRQGSPEGLRATNELLQPSPPFL